jgi:Protein of unknown function (DUF1257)
VPCYEISVVSVEISASDRDILKRALDKLKMPHVTLSNGDIEVTAGSYSIIIGLNSATMDQRAARYLNQIRQAYSDESIEVRAEQLGFTVVEEEVTSEEANRDV